MPKTKNILETAPSSIVALMKETNEAYSSSDLALHLSLSQSACLGILYYMKETGVLDFRHLKRGFYFLKDKYTEQEIKNKIERAYLKKYDIKSIRRPG